MSPISYFIIYCICVFVLCFCLLYFSSKQEKQRSTYISNVKEQLEHSGFIFNHSYKLINKEDGTIRFLRIFDIKYNPNNKKIYAHVYMTTNEDQIGTWYDEYTYLLDIHKKWTLNDNGEWNVE